MIHRTPQAEINDYYDRIGVNQSIIKVIIKHGMQNMLLEKDILMHSSDDLFYEEKEHFLIGSAVDCKITKGETAYQLEYSTLPVKPPDKPMAVVKQAFEALRASNVEILPDIWLYERELWEQANIVGYYLNRKKEFKDDERISGMLKKYPACQIYWEGLLRAEGKQLLTVVQETIVNDIYMSLMTHPFTRGIFNDDTYSGEDMDILYQVPIYWTEIVDEYPVDCKILMDGIRIKHSSRRISPFELKTTGDVVTKFNEQMKFRRYDIQGGYYKYGLTKNLNRISEIVGRDVSGYDVDPFAFIVESSKAQGTPLIFPMTEGLTEVGRIGDEDGLSGWWQGLRTYVEWEKNGFDLAQLLDGTRGIVFINEFFELELNKPV